MDDPSTCTALVLYAGNGNGATEESASVTAVADSSVTGDGARSDGLAPKFVGLSNQGATCYMNSLLQTLYMTPEVCVKVSLCTIIYSWCVCGVATQYTNKTVEYRQCVHKR